jgi:predicted O-methyltransferase YrrM
MNMIDRVLDAIRQGEAEGLMNNRAETVLSGFSGRKLIGSLQRLAAHWRPEDDACYVEIGVFQGLTLLSVAVANPQLPCYGIDNFAFFDPQSKNLGLVRERQAKLGADNAAVINLDYEDALENLATHIGGRKIGLLFVDGPHDYRSQLMCLELALPHLHERAVIAIDDCNYRHVRQANRDFLVTHPDYALAFEAYTARHPSNMDRAENDAARESWWNGVNIIARDPERRLARSFPPTHRSRAVYENEHFVHATDVAPHAVEAMRVAQMVAGRHVWGFLKAVIKLDRVLRSSRIERKDLYKSLNTYSDTLPKSRYCSLADS